MPYIETERRKEIDHIIDMMVACDIRANGDLNYILYRFCKEVIPRSYNSYKNYIGELNECVVEIRRTLLGPYEDEKSKKNPIESGKV